MATRQQPDDDTTDTPSPVAAPSYSEVLLYALAVVIGIAIMLAVPRLLNNMIVVFVVLLVVVWLVPALLRKRR